MRSRLLGRMFRRLGDFLDSPSSDDKGKTPLEGKHTVPASYRELNKDNYEERLRSFKKNKQLTKDALVTGSVELIGLNQVKERFGDQWEMMRETAKRVVVNTVEAKIKPNDLYLQINEEYYVILFNETPQEEAHFKAREIAYEISRQLYGEIEETKDMVSVRGLALEVPPSEQADRLETPEQLITYLLTARHRRESSQKAKAKKEISQIGVAYRPMINVRKRMISFYTATLVRHEDEDGKPQLGLHAYPKDETGLLSAEMDAHVLREVGKILPELGGLHQKSMVLVPLHYDTLAVKRFREAYVEAFKELDDYASHRLMLMLVDVPPGIPQGRLHSLLTVVFPFTLGFFCRIRRGDLDTFDFSSTGVRGIAIDDEGDDRPTKGAVAGFLDFLRMVHKRKLRALFIGLHHPDMASAMASIGYDYISGDALAGLVPKPGRAYRLDKGPPKSD